jgi:arylsulfatase A-like enzyme
MTDRPDILILMTDQHRADCLGCAGHPQLRTPNLDRLAREGARFTQATTVSPLCMPARASFATGLYPHDHGMWRNNGALDPNRENLFQLLQKGGYFTAAVGKAHYYEHEPGTDLRDREDFMHALGFSYVHETAGQVASLRTASHLTDEWRRRGLWDALQADYADRTKDEDQVVRPSVLPVDDFLDSYIGRKAVDFVDAYEDARPLCLFVGFAGPHNPWDAPGPYASMYESADTPAPIPIPPLPAGLPAYVEPRAPFRHGPTLSPARIAEIRANYYGKITLIDDRVGRLLEAFERKGRLRNALVVFTADHGEMLGDHGRLRKGLFYESSLRIPLLMRWPGMIPAGLVSDALVENIDVFPTLLEAAGVAAKAWHAGRSLWPVLRGTSPTLRRNQLCESGRSLKHFMLRTPEYKLAVDARERPYLLFHLADDPDEQRNRVGDAAAAALEQRLREELQRRLQESSSHG